MPRLRNLSGEDVVKIFISFSFQIVARKGSHVKLVRFSDGGVKQTLTIPDHSELDKGTLKAIYRQSLRYIPEQELRLNFYS
jgi:predicted RNA binding protein YcfA (HicA-like mRNA interferase family)